MLVGNFHLENPFILAPMAGITDLPYRRLMKDAGAALVFTEMVSANGLDRDSAGTRDLLRSCPEEGPLGIQLFGSDPEVLARAAAEVTPLAAVIDLNFGCPAPKVIRNHSGSALLRDPQRLGRIIGAVRRATPLPLFVKIRAGWDAASVNYLEIGAIACAEGADALTLHPRTRSQGFGGRADWSLIRRLKEALPVPVIGSGDVFSADDALRMRAETGCDGVMIARGGLGNPWLFEQALAGLAGRPALLPDPQTRGRMARRHYQLQVETFGPVQALGQMRKHLAWYSRGMRGSSEFRARINRLDGVDAVMEALNRFFGDSGRQEVAT
jgi:nifR3 family TIM-barrel protein